MSKFAQKVREKRDAERAARKAAESPSASAVAKPTDPEEYLRQLDASRRKSEEAQRAAQAQIASERSRAEKLQAQLDAMHAESKRAKIREGVKSAAKAAGALDEDDAADLILARHRLTLTDDGKVIREDDPAADVTATVKGFLENKPHLVRSTVSPGSGAPTFTKPAPSGGPAPSFREDPTRAMRAFLTNEIASSPGANGAGRDRGN